MKKRNPFSEHQLMYKPESLAIENTKKQLGIGIPREREYQENRVCLTPDAVEVLVANGHKVFIESCAGEKSGFTDKEYSDVGAVIKYDTKGIYEQSIILKINPPCDEEIEYLKPKSILISALQLSNQRKEYFEKLRLKKCTAFAFDFITDENNQAVLVRLMSEIAGTASIIIGGQLMQNVSNGGCGVLLGGVPGTSPCEVVILGAGTVGFNAARSALGLGAVVKIFDNSIDRLRRIQIELGQRVFTSLIEPKILGKALMRCNLAIGAIRGNKQTPIIVSEEMVMKMKKKAVIVDVCIDVGGCFETSRTTTLNNPTFVKHEVIHYGVTNIPSLYPKTATQSLSNFFLPSIQEIGEFGGIHNFLKTSKGWQSGIYIYHGIITNSLVGEMYNLEYQDLNLLFL